MEKKQIVKITTEKEMKLVSEKNVALDVNVLDVICECGKTGKLNWTGAKFDVNILGLIQCKCHNCGKIINTDGLWC